MKQLTVKGMAHITGGGLLENIPRVLPDNTVAVIAKSSWTLPPVFRWLMEKGGVAEREMHRTFNCGIGMVVVIDHADADAAAAFLADQGETVYRLGEIALRQDDEHQTIIR
jgi:phosphoribosylformylglycinamidine cyclo-ligase